eukprot:7329802-Pyramimonas_sp.AAC.1
MQARNPLEPSLHGRHLVRARDCGGCYGETTMVMLSVFDVVTNQDVMIAASIRNFPRGLSSSASAPLSTTKSD